MKETLTEVWRRWPIQIVAVIAMAYFTALAAPSLTWINTDSDGAIYLNAAKHLMPSHPTGAPAYNLFNVGMLWIVPYNDLAWRLALGSAIFAGATAGLLYKETRSLIPVLIFAGAGVVVSQATIIETYSMVTFCMVGMYVYRRQVGVAVAFAFVGLGVHHLIGLTLIPLFLWHRSEGYSLKPYLWLLLSPLWYLWLLTVRPDSVWLSELTIPSIIDYFSGQGGLVLGIAILGEGRAVTPDAWTRLADAAVFIFGGFLAAIVPLVLRRKNDLLFWLFALPVIHYVFGLPALAWVYLMPAFAFGGVMAWDYLQKSEAIPHMRTAVAGFAVIAVLWNFGTYDIGKSLDPDLTATAFYNSLDDIPKDAWVFTARRGWELITIDLYSRDHDGKMAGATRHFYQQPIGDIREAIAIAGHEGRLYRTVVTDPKTYAADLQEATPWDIWPELIKQRYKFEPDYDGRFDQFRWSETALGKSGTPYGNDYAAEQTGYY